MRRFLQRPRASPSAFLYRPRQTLRRPYSAPPLPKEQSRLARLESRLPRFLSRYITPLRTAPLSHITAFLILHELTAVIPLFGLAAYFHYTNYLPPYFSSGAFVADWTEKFGKLLRKWGWLGAEDESRRYKWWSFGEKGTRLAVELATAYAITKVLLPLRIAVSVWGTPWFARWTVLPVTGWVGRMFGFGKTKGVVKSAGAGTGAVGGGVMPKNGK